MKVFLMVTNGYPFKFSAINSKGEFIAKGLNNNKVDIIIIDNILGQRNLLNIEQGVSNNGIKYYLFPQKIKLISIITNLIKLYGLIKKEKSLNENYAIIEMDYLPIYILINLIFKIHGIKTSVLFHEWHPSFKYDNYFKKYEAILRDKIFGYFANGIFPISHFLLEKSQKFKKPCQILPILSEYPDYESNTTIKKNFTYCGDSAYLLRNPIIIEAFIRLQKEYNNAKLNLIIGGLEKDKIGVLNLIHSHGLENNITIYSNLPQEELFNMYKSSTALLIPLNPNNIQDIARFSQKIAEYIGTKRPIITNNVGEISYYFKNKENAMIVEYNSNAYFEAMKFLLKNQEISNSIGANGFNVGKKYFDINTNGTQIIEFLKRLNK